VLINAGQGEIVMPMLTIEGTYRVIGAAPDGDSVRFTPNDPAQWDLVGGPHTVRRNASGGAQLRLDGIDALETHYPTSGGIVHQPLEFGHQAATGLLDWLGFSGVTRDEAEKVTAATPDQVPGYILTRTADIYGRCVALAGRGAAPAASGGNVHVSPELVAETINYQQLVSGVAYPTFYRKLYPDLRAAMTEAAAAARAAGTGLWSQDVTNSGADLTEGVAALADKAVVLPKLFRRLTDYYGLNHGDPSLAGFAAYLAQRNDRVLILPAGHWTSLDTAIDVAGQTIRLTTAPENLVFDER
jgi:endonuclease YncB( thermonuclease family)